MTALGCKALSPGPLRAGAGQLRATRCPSAPAAAPPARPEPGEILGLQLGQDGDGRAALRLQLRHGDGALEATLVARPDGSADIRLGGSVDQTTLNRLASRLSERGHTADVGGDAGGGNGDGRRRGGDRRGGRRSARIAAARRRAGLGRLGGSAAPTGTEATYMTMGARRPAVERAGAPGRGGPPAGSSHPIDYRS